MAGLINTTEGYLAQTVGQLTMEKCALLAQIDKLQGDVENLRAKLPPEPSLAGDDLHS